MPTAALGREVSHTIGLPAQCQCGFSLHVTILNTTRGRKLERWRFLRCVESLRDDRLQRKGDFPVRISNDYFQRLLKSSDASKAVFELDTIWCCRQGRAASQPRFGLSSAEYDVHMFLLYQGDVGNGGHQQFFLNPAGDFVCELQESLHRLGLGEVLRILLDAISVFSKGSVPRNAAERKTVISQITQADLHRWDRLDREFYAIEKECWQQILNYLQLRENEVLLPERGAVVSQPCDPLQ